jgi:hypothetical protein
MDPSRTIPADLAAASAAPAAGRLSGFKLGCAAFLSVSLVLSGCTIPMGIRNVQVATREDKKPLDRQIGAEVRIESGSVAVLRVTQTQQTQVDILAVYHRMRVTKDFSLLILATVGTAALLFFILLIVAINADDGGGGGGGGDWDWD